MKKTLLLLAVAAQFFTFSCTNDLQDDMTAPQVSAPQTNSFDESLFPVADNSKRLSTNNATALRDLMNRFDKEKALVMGETKITDEQFAEIKQFVDENLQRDNDYDTYKAIFNWICSNLKYVYGADEEAYLDPYDVFIHRKCVCQGYANLLKTMCITQGIPAICVNGWLGDIGGHAWNYVYAGGMWYVSDPTNGGEHKMGSGLNNYKNWLMPYRTDLDLFEDDNFCYNFENGQLNVSAVKSTGKAYVTVPYSVSNFRVTSFCPLKEVAPSVTQLYIGTNIEIFGSEPNIACRNLPGLQELFVAEGNRKIESYENIVYQKGSTTPLFIPAGITRVVLKPMKTVEKNTLFNLPNVTEIVVAEGTERIEAYAFEQCPKLRTLYVPEGIQYIDKDAVYDSNSTYEIVYTSTGIHEVTM